MEDKFKTEKSRHEAIEAELNRLHTLTGGTLAASTRVGGLGWGYQHSANGWRLERMNGAISVGVLYKKWADFYEFLMVYRSGVMMGRDAMRQELGLREWKPTEGDVERARAHEEQIRSNINAQTRAARG